MTQKSIVIKSALDARQAAYFVQTAGKFEAEIHVSVDEKKINAKSIMGVMTLCTADCHEIEVVAEGQDAEKAVDHIEKYLKNENN